MRLRNRFWTSRPGLALSVLLGWPVGYRLKVVGFIDAERMTHGRVVNCDFRGDER